MSTSPLPRQSAPAIPDWLPGYFAARDAERREAVQETLDRLTERERALVREAAVMGFVHGRNSALGWEDDHPKDSAVLFGVVSACRAMSDIYPLLGGDS